MYFRILQVRVKTIRKKRNKLKGEIMLFGNRIHFRALLRAFFIAIVITILFACLCSTQNDVFAGTDKVRILIDGRVITSDSPPEIKNNRTMVPIRAISEGLGYDVKWNPVEYTVIITKTDKNAQKLVGVAINSDIVMIDGKAHKIDVKPYIKMPENRTMVPLRVISEAMDCKVDWNGTSRTVSISTMKSEGSDDADNSNNNGNNSGDNNETKPNTNSDVPTVPENYHPYADGKLIVALDPGHGKNTPGKRSPDESLREYEFNRAVAYRVRDLLTAQGITVIMTVPDDDLNDVPLRKRTDIANAADADVFVSFHANALKNTWTEHRGWEIYYKPNDSFSKTLAKHIKSASYPTHGEGIGIPFRGIKTAKFFVIRHTKMPAVLIEHGFMTNEIECELLKTDEFRDKVANADAKGIMDFIYSFKDKPIEES